MISDKTTVRQHQIKYIQSQINTEMHKTARHNLATLTPGLQTPLYPVRRSFVSKTTTFRKWAQCPPLDGWKAMKPNMSDPSVEVHATSYLQTLAYIKYYGRCNTKTYTHTQNNCKTLQPLGMFA